MIEAAQIQEVAEQEETTQPEVSAANKALAEFWDVADAKAADLTKSIGRKIIPFSIFGDDFNDHVLGFMYEHDGLTDVKLAAAKLQGAEASMPKAIQALESLILFDQSDPRMKERKYMNGAALFLLSLVEIGMPERKKK